MIKLQRETIGPFVARKTRSSELLLCYSSKNKETFWAVIVFTDLLGGVELVFLVNDRRSVKLAILLTSFQQQNPILTQT